jgi:flagellar hook assembly protein FlgD
MTRRLALIVAFALLLPASASAGLTALEVRELPLHGERTLQATTVAKPFQLVGVHWQGSGRLELRTRSRGGGWSRWTVVREETADAPDDASAEARASRGWHVGAPLWVGRAVKLEVRTSGRITRARALTIRSPVSRVPYRATAAAGAPSLVLRTAWQADESIVRARPSYAETLRMAHVHHTEGTNTYTRLEAPAVVRGIQTYHVKGNGWNDIGYNVLVDRFGTVYEGRGGGIDRNVVGAHARGFNTGSFGIAVMGDFRSVAPPAAALDALVQTLAWRLDLAHVDPLGSLNGISSGNERFGPGIPVFLRAISGHRDTGLTTCPGERLYALIPTLAKRVAALGLPKIYAPLVQPDETGATRFTARLSSPLPWSAVVLDAAGVELARGTGTGTAVDWTWLPPGPVPAGARWRIETPGATTAEGRFGITPSAGVLQLSGATAAPATISPNGDGQADAATISFTLSADANVTITVVDAAGATVAELEPRTWRRAGARTAAFDGQALADGSYLVRIQARATGGREATIDVPVAVTRTLGRVSLDTPVLTPNGDGRTDTVAVTIPSSQTVTATVKVLRGGRWVATPFEGTLEVGEHAVTWDGKKRLGKALDGAYTVSVEVIDSVGTSRVELPLLVDATSPRLRVVSAAPPRIWVSEAVTVTMRVNNARRVVRADAPGTYRIPRVVHLRTLVATARDAAGNTTTLRR